MEAYMKNTMLIVDDVELNREILKVLFHEEYRILEAEDGEEALAVLEHCEGGIDIVLLDLMMPGISGFEILEKREELKYFKKVPVVVITSSGNTEDQIKAFDAGANDFINKPFIPEVVISRVNNVMSSHKRMISIELEAQKLRVKSEIDSMTGLYNKSTVEMIMEEVVKDKWEKLNVLMVIDIDNFKSVNDNMGHQAGDHVIKIIADLISSLFRKSDIIGRIGGDEFVVMMVDVQSMDIAYSKVNELIQIMRYKPNLTIPDYVSLSIGLSSNERRPISYSGLFKKADKALYHAKKGGKARYCEYGVEPINRENDLRPIVLLLSENRSVRSTVNALIPPDYKIIEVMGLEELDKVEKQHRDRIAIVYADVSEYEDETETFWKTLKTVEWISFQHVFAICQEGQTAQYATALKYDIADMFTSPIDNAGFKRRLIKFLENKAESENEKID